MGNKIDTKSSFEENNWRQIQRSDFKVILHNDMTMKALERHQACSDDDEEYIKEVLTWRSQLPTSASVTELYEYGTIKNKGFCNNTCSVYVIVQRLCPLEQVRTLSKPQAFLMIRDVATALKHLIKKFGYFLPQQNMIGVNSYGRARIWINENSGVCSLQNDMIVAQQSQLTILNNVIRLIQPKVYRNSNFPVKFPNSLDFDSAISYIDKTFERVKGFRVDKIYLDREDFNKNYQKLRELEEKEERSRLVMEQAKKRLQEIQIMHLSLQEQQNALIRKQNTINQLSYPKYEKPPIPTFMVSHVSENRKQASRKLFLPETNDVSWEDSRKRKLPGTASTNNENEVFFKSNDGSILTFCRRNNLIKDPKPATPLINFDNQPKKSPQFELKISNVAQPPSKPAQVKQNYLLAVPPLPPKKIFQKKEVDKNTLHPFHQVRKEIEMVDSMILVQQVESEKNVQYVQSRLVQFPQP